MRVHRVLDLYREHLGDPARERRFLLCSSFSLAFGFARFAVPAVLRAMGLSLLALPAISIATALPLLLAGLLAASRSSSGEGLRLRERLAASLAGAGLALFLAAVTIWVTGERASWRANADLALLYVGMASTGVWGGSFFGALGRRIVEEIKKHFPDIDLEPPSDDDLPGPGGRMPAPVTIPSS